MRKLTKTFVLQLALTLGAVASVFAAASDYTGYRTSVASGTPQAVMLSFYDGPTTRGFTWQTDTSVSSGNVWLRQGDYTTKDDIVNSAEKTATVTKTSTSGCYAYKAYVTDLSDGLWSYCLGNDDKVVLGQFTVKATPTGPITIVNVNDVQTKTAAKLTYWQNTVTAITNRLGSGTAADFILSGGDFIDGTIEDASNIDNYVQWGVVADVARPALGSAPWIMASGNHDPNLYDILVGENFYQTSDPAGCHAFTYGNVHVATIPYASSLSSTVKTWLQNDLASGAAQNARWRIVVIHYGPYTTADHGRDASSSYVTGVSTVMKDGKVDLVLQAHDHTYSKTWPYRWSGAGYTGSLEDEVNVNLSPATTNISGVVYDLNPEGTYYVSAGCAGHRVGENKTIASSTYNIKRTTCLTVISTNCLTGANASQDLDHSMFGVLTVDGNKLAYDWYAVNNDGTATHFDTLRVCKAQPGDAPDPVTPVDPTPSGNYVKYGSQYITYTGTSVETAENVAGTTDTVLIFKDNGTFKLPEDATARILVVGGGAGGVAAKKGKDSSTASSCRRYTGNGGNSGEAEEYPNVPMPSGDYNITVGAGGTGANITSSTSTDFTAGGAGEKSLKETFL